MLFMQPGKKLPFRVSQPTNKPAQKPVHTHSLALRLIYLKLAFSHSNARRRFPCEAKKWSSALPSGFVCVLLVICIKITHTTRFTGEGLKLVVPRFQG